MNVAGGTTNCVGFVDAERVVAIERAHHEIVEVDVLSRAMGRDAKPMIWL
jgi:hypothetical protein